MSRAGGIATREKFQAMQRERVEDLLFLIDAGVAVGEALRRVDWTPEAAYRWARRHGDERVAALVREEYNAHKARVDRIRAGVAA